MTVGGVFCPRGHYESKGLYTPTQLSPVSVQIVNDFRQKINRQNIETSFQNFSDLQNEKD